MPWISAPPPDPCTTCGKRHCLLCDRQRGRVWDDTYAGLCTECVAMERARGYDPSVALRFLRERGAHVFDVVTPRRPSTRPKLTRQEALIANARARRNAAKTNESWDIFMRANGRTRTKIV